MNLTARVIALIIFLSASSVSAEELSLRASKGSGLYHFPESIDLLSEGSDEVSIFYSLNGASVQEFSGSIPLVGPSHIRALAISDQGATKTEVFYYGELPEISVTLGTDINQSIDDVFALNTEVIDDGNPAIPSFLGYGNFIGFSFPMELSNGTWALGLNAGYWHASLPSPQTESVGSKLEGAIGSGHPEYFEAPRGGRQLVLRSSDKGRTWENAVVVADTEGDDRAGNFLELPDGTLLSSFFSLTARDVDLSDLSKGSHVYVTRSEDGGESWQTPIKLPDQLNYGKTTGPMIQAEDGSILLASYGYMNPEQSGFLVARIHASRDQGQTWSLRSVVEADFEMDEPAIAKLSDGTIVMVSRPEGAIAWSYDSGRSFTKPTPFGIRMFDPGLIVLPNGVLVCTFGLVGRGLSHVIFSKDGGRTWVAPELTRGFRYGAGYGYARGIVHPDLSISGFFMLYSGISDYTRMQNTIYSQRFKINDAFDSIEFLPPLYDSPAEDLSPVTLVDERLSDFTVPDVRPPDSDSDGVNDFEELVQGSNPFSAEDTSSEDDSNSTEQSGSQGQLQTPAYVRFNTFLGMQNYLELTSLGDSPLKVTVSAFSANGTLLNRSELYLSQQQQFDLDINALVQRENEYGVIEIEFDSSDVTSRLLARLSHYRKNVGSENYSFAFSRDLKNPIVGESFLMANSIDPEGRGHRVPNWIEIVNLSKDSQGFTIRSYRQDGALLGERILFVPAFSSLDVAGGHEIAEGVFLHSVTPHSSETPYLASVSRYRPSPNGIDFDFAFSAPARVGMEDDEVLLASNLEGSCWSESNWLEVANISATSKRVKVDLTSSSGGSLPSLEFEIPGFSQHHISVDSFLAPGEIGFASVVSETAASLLAQSLVYAKDCRDLSLQTAYLVPSLSSQSDLRFGSLNTFLGMSNELFVLNSSDTRKMARLSMGSMASSTFASRSISLSGSKISQIRVAPSDETLSSDTYASFAFEGGSEVYASVFRKRERQDGGLDFVVPISIR